MAAKGILVYWRSLVVILTPLILLPLPLVYEGRTVGATTLIRAEPMLAGLPGPWFEYPLQSDFLHQFRI